jgi:hypothetical protein
VALVWLFQSGAIFSIKDKYREKGKFKGGSKITPKSKENHRFLTKRDL